MLITPSSYMHPLRSRCGYDTYHSVPGIDRYVYILIVYFPLFFIFSKDRAFGVLNLDMISSLDRPWCSYEYKLYSIFKEFSKTIL